MMATTARGVPYPAATDANDVPTDFAELAAWINDHPGVAVLTTAQRDALAGEALWDGRVILNPTSGTLERYDAGATVWRSASVADHGNLTGLADDDHPQYLTTGRHDTTARHGSTVVDHGQIGGLGDDDHQQYVRADRARNATPLRLVRSGKDANGIFTTIEYHRVGGNLAIRSVLSGGASPTYTTRTVTEYDLDGTTAVRTTVYSLTYDAEQLLTTETVA
jgi:hypothetical protein